MEVAYWWSDHDFESQITGVSLLIYSPYVLGQAVEVGHKKRLGCMYVGASTLLCSNKNTRPFYSGRVLINSSKEQVSKDCYLF